MRYYPLLSDEEIHAICSCYPYKEMITGFKKCPKDFSTLMPGHRPQSVSEESGRSLIANNLHSTLTAKMIEVLLSSWVPRISSSVKDQIANGKDMDYAYIVSFSMLGVPSFVNIYFHIADEGFNGERIQAIRAGVEALSAEKERARNQIDVADAAKQSDELNRQQKKKMKEKDLEIKRSASEIKKLKKELSKERKTIDVLQEDNKRLAIIQTKFSEVSLEIERLKKELTDGAEQFKKIEEEYKESEERNKGYKEAIDSIQSELKKCQTYIAELDRIKKSTLDLIYSDTADELRPVDMDEFKEYLSYNLTNLGLNTTKPYFPLLLGYIANTVFTNKPIICNHATGLALAKCISNTLCGTQNPNIIPYSRELSCSDIRSILETEARILVFDSFIGNFNEKELLPILRSVKRKIIFITAEYDKTITYLLPEEVLLNCIYINANHIPELLTSNGLDEDPSTLREELILPIYESPNSRAQRLSCEIMKELGFSLSVTNVLSAQMTSLEMLDEYLAFSVIPYSVEAHGLSPYNTSDRLDKYAGFSGKCAHKDLLMEWYGND